MATKLLPDQDQREQTHEHQICHVPLDWAGCYIEKRETNYDKALCGADIRGRVSHSRAECEANPLHSRCVVCMDMVESMLNSIWSSDAN